MRLRFFLALPKSFDTMSTMKLYALIAAFLWMSAGVSEAICRQGVEE
ncbi:MAG: hypothetical protein IKK15_02005 [Akkermansia sp.]|nr:hypothetical protein [Akkermansia sp.]